MRTTLALDDDLVAKAVALTGLRGEDGPRPRGAQGADRARERAPAGETWRQRTKSQDAAAARDRGVILVDTSIWIDHLRAGDNALGELLDAGQVLTHPFVVGELALGNLRRRGDILFAMSSLPLATVVTATEVLQFIDSHRLFASGIGYVDAHLLAAAQLTPGTSLWTRDRQLNRAAHQLGLAMARRAQA